MASEPDTIVALSTPSGESALALIRLSGPDALALGRRLLDRKEELVPRKATVGNYHDLSGKMIDQVVTTGFVENSSFTGEAMLEISCHGNPILIQKIIEDLVGRGARVALPGEFTRRAYLNGQLDLTQAEAIGDLIHARSDLALNSARQQLRGSIGLWISECSEALLSALASLEAYIDFPDEDLPTEDESGPLKTVLEVRNKVAKVLNASHYRDIVQEGIKTIILGAPNAGKSSLLNALLGEERALVSAEPGTTRDYIREEFLLGKHSIQLMDTAGIHQPTSELEDRGIQKALELIDQADFFLVVLDASLPAPTFPSQVIEKLTADRTLVLENKLDLDTHESSALFLAECAHVRLSLTENLGWKAFLDTWESALESRTFTPPPDLILANARHASSLRQVIDQLDLARQKHQKKESPELIVEELRIALDGFSEIIGKIDNEAMLDKLFKNYCIGK